MKIGAYRQKSYLFRLILLANQVEKSLLHDLGQFKMTIVQALCLIAIFSEQEDAILLSRLSLTLGYKKSLISHAIASLENDGYLKRSILHKDRRRYKFSVTEKTKRTVPKLIQLFDRHEDHIESVLKSSDKDALDRIFKNILS